MKRLMKLLAGLSLVAIGAGCGTMRYGDGKAGPIPLDSVGEAIASGAEKAVPGSGKVLREYFGGAAVDRVPEGYKLLWTYYLEGKVVDPSKIKAVPSLVAANAAAPVVVVDTSPERVDNVDTSPDPTPAIEGASESIDAALDAIGSMK